MVILALVSFLWPVIVLLLFVAGLIGAARSLGRAAHANHGGGTTSLRDLALGCGIAVLLPLVVHYGVSVIIVTPRMGDYLPTPGMSDQERYKFLGEDLSLRQTQYIQHLTRYAQHVALLSVPVGFAAMIAGWLVAVNAIAAGRGLFIGGALSILYGLFRMLTVSEFQSGMLEGIITATIFLGLPIAFIISTIALIISAYRKFGRRGRR